MDNFTIINLQALLGSVTFYLAFRWWVQPRVSKLPIQEALLPFVFLNAFRYLGLSFMLKDQFYSGFPIDFLTSVGYWDFLTSILALLTSAALKTKWKYAIPLVWVFNVFGFADLVVSFPKFFSLKIYDHDLGFIWLLFVTYGLTTFLSHIYIFYRLIKNFWQK